jgi:hypothetical protein
MMIENQYSLAPALGESLKKYQGLAGIIGLIGIIALFAGYFISTPEQFLRSYLVGFWFWIGMAGGCLVLVMIQYTAGGAWGMMIRRIGEAGMRCLPLMVILALPLLFGTKTLYVWAQPAVADHDKVIQGKHFYLNLPFFYGRAVLYFAVWGALVYLLSKWSLEQDRTGDIKIAKKLEALSGAGIVLFTFTMTFASVDWLMSLDPHWFSTIYGLLICVGQTLSAMALVVAAVILLSGHAPLNQLITKRHLLDLGKLMLALTMLWAYLSFSQLILIWSGNLPEEITYYIDRLNGGWEYLGAFLFLFHFTFPFLMLLSQKLKKNPRTLYKIAIYIIVVRLLDVFWLVEPNFHGSNFQIHWLDVVAPIGIGGLWLAFFLYNLRQRPILPINAPDLQKALDHGRHHH